MKYRKECECCGHVEAAYTHRLNKTIIGTLITFVELYQRVNRPVNVNTEINWSHNQLASFRKLKFFGLVDKTNNNGCWVPTTLGLRFYYGEASVTNPAASLNDQVLPPDHEAWATHEETRTVVKINDIEETHYKKRPEYQGEKSAQSTIYD